MVSQLRGRAKRPFFLPVVMAIALFSANIACGLSLRDPAYDGMWQDYGGGWWYCYYTSPDSAQWKYGNALKFSYSYVPGQWSTYDASTTWCSIGTSGVSCRFIGDGGWHDMKNGFIFQYYLPWDREQWARTGSLGNTFRFSYDYGTGRWLDRDNFNKQWYAISGLGASGAFIGDGGWYDMKNGFTFNYAFSVDRGNWVQNSAFRFTYDYTIGQWEDYDKFNTGHFISWAGASGAFIGDGGWYDMKNGLKFNYSASRNRANWAVGTEFRFVYDYNTARWMTSDKLKTWNYLSAAGANGGCIGDGNWYDLSNGYTFSYSTLLDKAYWAQNSVSLFAYEYSVGQWWDHGYNDVWNTLGSAAITSAFIGDHQFHNVGLHDGYWYQYWYDNQAYYAVSASGQLTDKFVYNYSTGQWRYIITSRWENLGPSGQSSEFAWVGMGDVGLRWQFASGIDPSVIGFNVSNTIDAFIMFDGTGDGSLDRILYFDDYGHKVAEGEITTGSMGIRIAVDKSYVGAGDSWSDYWPFWSESIPYSPLVYIFDNEGNQLFKQYYVQYMSAIGAGYDMRDGEAWIWEDMNGNGVYDPNSTDSGDKILHWRKQKGGTCGLYSVMNIVESVKGNGSNQVQFSSSYPDDTIQWFSDTVYSPDQTLYYRFNPPYDPKTMDLHDPIYGTWGGVYPEEQTQYMTTQQGFQNPQWTRGTMSWDNFVAQVESGKLALTEVDAYSIWAFVFPATDSKGQPRDADHDGYLDAGYNVTGLEVPSGVHWVWVTGFQRDAAGNITHVLIEDSALFQGSVGRVPVDHFEHGWERNNLRRAGFFDPPSGFTWTAAGENTWKFSPQVWSAAW